MTKSCIIGNYCQSYFFLFGCGIKVQTKNSPALQNGGFAWVQSLHKESQFHSLSIGQAVAIACTSILTKPKNHFFMSSIDYGSSVI